MIAETLGVTPAEYNEAIGCPAYGPDADVPQSWLGGMLLRVLREAVPMKRASGRALFAGGDRVLLEQGTTASARFEACLGRQTRPPRGRRGTMGSRARLGRQAFRVHRDRQIACQRPIRQQQEYPISRSGCRWCDPGSLETLACGLQAGQCDPRPGRDRMSGRRSVFWSGRLTSNG